MLGTVKNRSRVPIARAAVRPAPDPHRRPRRRSGGRKKSSGRIGARICAAAAGRPSAPRPLAPVPPAQRPPPLRSAAIRAPRGPAPVKPRQDPAGRAWAEHRGSDRGRGHRAQRRDVAVRAGQSLVTRRGQQFPDIQRIAASQLPACRTEPRARRRPEFRAHQRGDARHAQCRQSHPVQRPTDRPPPRRPSSPVRADHLPVRSGPPESQTRRSAALDTPATTARDRRPTGGRPLSAATARRLREVRAVASTTVHRRRQLRGANLPAARPSAPAPARAGPGAAAAADPRRPRQHRLFQQLTNDRERHVGLKTSRPRARSDRNPRSPAIRCTAASSCVFPIPAGPLMVTTAPLPAHAFSSKECQPRQLRIPLQQQRHRLGDSHHA